MQNPNLVLSVSIHNGFIGLLLHVHPHEIFISNVHELLSENYQFFEGGFYSLYSLFFMPSFILHQTLSPASRIQIAVPALFILSVNLVTEIPWVSALQFASRFSLFLLMSFISCAKCTHGKQIDGI